jgi:hypothetical protein
VNRVLLGLLVVLLSGVESAARPPADSSELRSLALGQGWQVVKIREGHHFTAEIPYRLMFHRRQLRYQMRFDTSFRCNVPQRDRYAINKVFGIGFLHHKLNSARLGWVFNPDSRRLELWAYCYVNTRRRFKKLTEVEWNALYDCSLDVDYEQKQVVFRLQKPDGSQIEHAVSYDWLPPIQYRLRPFFGGTKPASHDITFRLKEIRSFTN